MPAVTTLSSLSDSRISFGRSGRSVSLIQRSNATLKTAIPASAVRLARGFEQTTVAQIAKRAGLTERTFFRHFADKCEVLFWGADSLRELPVGTVSSAPDSAAPIDAVAAALEVAGALLQERRESARQRQTVIVANAELQERELIKLASLAYAMADALRQPGVRDPARCRAPVPV